MIPASLFSSEGIDVGSGSRNLNYLYGLSDFFAFSFEDVSTVNLMLEANAVSASEIYSKFLQLTSSISLADVQTEIGTGIKLILVKATDKIGSTPKYRVNVPMASARFMSNRPFLPTESLENEVDFRISPETTTTSIIQFARPLEEYKFSKRITTDGVDEYAIWLTDVALDEQLMYKHYGRILGVSPEVSSEQFSNFVYGLYYLYLNGPTLKVMEQGLNLVLGVPLVRSAGTVLDVRYNIETSQYLVITDADQYVLPANLTPIVQVGDAVELGGALAKWIELKDSVENGNWWINVSIPDTVIRALTGSQVDRFARPGSNFDYLMSNFLYKNTFLVRINIGVLNSGQYFDYLQQILTNAKPSYTQPIYVWKLDMGGDELFSVTELSFDTHQVPSIMTAINCQPIDQTCI